MSNLYFQSLSLVYMSIVLFLFFYKKRVQNVETRIFSFISVVNIIGIVLDIVIVYLSYTIPFHVSLYVLNKLYLLYILYWVALFTVYIANISLGERKKLIKFFQYSTLLVCIVSTGLIVGLPIILINDLNIMYTTGPSVNFLISMCALFIGCIVIVSVINYKKLISKKYIPVFGLIVLSIIGLIVRQLNPTILLTTTVMTIINILMFFTIENPDVKMIEKLEIAKASAEKANNAKSDFLSSMSHEIRTPLNAIVGFSECIKQAENLEEAFEDSDHIIEASNALLEIVNGILDISKIEAGKIEIVNSPYDTAKLFSNVETLVRGRLGEKDLDFRVKISEDIPKTLYGDRANLQKVIINLLTNSLKYTDKGYFELNISCVNKDNICRLIVAVEDSGRGIKKDKISNLFTKFDRLEEDRNTSIEGTGLGLAITKQLVEMMGGTIVVQTEYGIGSKFTVAVDQRIETIDLDEPEAVTKIEKLDLSGKKILIVDDNALNLKVASRLLKQYNPEIITINNGLECINKVKAGEHFDLILMDDMMPRMTGVETFDRLKKIDGFNIPTIALTANALVGMKEKYINEGFNDYLAKPIDKIELYKVLKKYIKGGKVKEAQSQLKMHDFSNKKILVVDDNKLNLRIAEAFLRPYGCSIKTVMSGKECLDIIKTEKFDMIFMDDMMPRMSGSEVLVQIKNELLYERPIVVLTANAIAGSREEYLEKGFDEYISKPIDKRHLDDVLNMFFEEGSKRIQKGLENDLMKKGININSGIKTFGDIDKLKEGLAIFNRDLIPKLKGLKSNMNDLNSYSIMADRLTRDTNDLGISELEELFANHAKAAMANDKRYIEENFGILVDTSRKYYEIINDILK